MLRRSPGHALTWLAVLNFAASETCSSGTEDSLLLGVQLALKQSKEASLPSGFAHAIEDAAWKNRSSLALNLLQQLDASGRLNNDRQLVDSAAIALARYGKLSEAAALFERAALLPPPSVQRFTKHRLQNLKLLSGERPPTIDVRTLLPSDDAGGWRIDAERGNDDVLPCEVDARSNLSAHEFKERYVLQGRPVLVPLHEVVARCIDAGPWPCSEDGCPSDPLGCDELAALGVCDRSFKDVWETPPAGIGSELVSSQCPKACGTCAAQGRDGLLWTRSELLRRAGECILPMVTSSGVVEHQYRSAQGSSGTAPGGQERQTTLREFVEAEMPLTVGGKAETALDGGEDSDLPYIVATRPSQASPSVGALAAQQRQCWRILDGSMRLTGLGAQPNVFLSDHVSHKRILFMGPIGSGTGFHDHSNTFSLLPHGRKRWLLLPPSGLYAPTRPEGSIAAGKETHKLRPLEWLRRHEAQRTDLPIAPLQCIQPAGTALFVPSGWKHATVNVAPSVGIAIEVGDVDVISRAQRAAA